jgi:hypothetical protein
VHAKCVIVWFFCCGSLLFVDTFEVRASPATLTTGREQQLQLFFNCFV